MLALNATTSHYFEMETSSGGDQPELSMSAKTREKWLAELEELEGWIDEYEPRIFAAADELSIQLEEYYDRLSRASGIRRALNLPPREQDTST
jgi:hypothetical protein